jgi:hypothetical protein
MASELAKLTNNEYFLVELRNAFLGVRKSPVTEAEIFSINARVDQIFDKMEIHESNAYIGRNQALQPADVMGLRNAWTANPFTKCKIRCRQVLGEPGTEAVLKRPGSIEATGALQSKAGHIFFAFILITIVLGLLIFCSYITVPLIAIYILGASLGLVDLASGITLLAIQCGWQRRLPECKEMRSIPPGSDLEKIANAAERTLQKRGILYDPKQKITKRQWFYQQLIPNPLPNPLRNWDPL